MFEERVKVPPQTDTVERRNDAALVHPYSSTASEPPTAQHFVPSFAKWSNPLTANGQ
jgi:hypothetical protein